MTYLADSDIIIKLLDGSNLSDDLPSDRPFIGPHAHVEKRKEIQDKAMRAKLLLKSSEYGQIRSLQHMTVADGDTAYQLFICVTA